MAARVEVATARHEVVDLEGLDDVRTDPGPLGQLVDAQAGAAPGPAQLRADDRVDDRHVGEVVDQHRRREPSCSGRSPSMATVGSGSSAVTGSPSTSARTAVTGSRRGLGVLAGHDRGLGGVVLEGPARPRRPGDIHHIQGVPRVLVHLLARPPRPRTGRPPARRRAAVEVAVGGRSRVVGQTEPGRHVLASSSRGKRIKLPSRSSPRRGRCSTSSSSVHGIPRQVRPDRTRTPCVVGDEQRGPGVAQRVEVGEREQQRAGRRRTSRRTPPSPARPDEVRRGDQPGEPGRRTARTRPRRRLAA